ncbi:MAG: SufE family protein, partial [Cytophagales bacterium]
MSLNYLMELGETMPRLTVAERKHSHMVPGCLARVWLLFHHEEERMFIKGDSDAMVTKGLVGLLIRILSGQKNRDIAMSTPVFPAEFKLVTWLTQQRRGGFLQMWTDVQQAANHCMAPLRH